MAEKRLGVWDANLLYLAGAVLLLFIGGYVQGREVISGLLITQYVLILLPPLVYLKVRGLSIKKELRLNPLKAGHGFKIVLITLLTYPAALTANVFLMYLLSLLGNLNIPELPTAETGGEYLLLMFVISLSAGICEEVMFRGFILRGYEQIGKRKAIFLSAVLFGLFHFNLYNLAGPIVLGLVFAYLVNLTDSLYAGMVGHAANNGFAVTLGFLLNRLTALAPLEGGLAEEAEVISTSASMLVSAAFFGTVALGTGLIAWRLVKSIKADLAGEMPQETYEAGFEPDLALAPVSPGKGAYVPFFVVLLIYLFYPAYLQLAEIISLG